MADKRKNNIKQGNGFFLLNNPDMLKKTLPFISSQRERFFIFNIIYPKEVYLQSEQYIAE